MHHDHLDVLGGRVAARADCTASTTNTRRRPHTIPDEPLVGMTMETLTDGSRGRRAT